MKGRCRLISLLLLMLITAGELHAQCPVPDFDLATTACRDQNLTLTNLSAAGTFQWDYCTGDLSNTPTADPGYTLTGANGRPAFEYAKDGNRWYAFATGTFTNRLFRITFDDPTQAPALVENLGDLGGNLNGPGSIRIINNSGQWVGLLHNTNNGELLKLSFGNSLANDITVTSLFTGHGGFNNGFAVAHDGANGWVCVLSTPGNTFEIIRLGENISAPSFPADLITTGTVPIQNALFDVDLVRMCDQWFAFAVNLGDGSLSRLQFGSSLFQNPTIDGIGTIGENGGRLRILKDGEEYHLLVTALSGKLYNISLGNDLANLSMNTQTLSGLPGAMSIGAVLHNSTWSISVLDPGTGNVSSINFPNTCSVTEFNTDPNEPGIRYTDQGTYDVSLTMTDGSGISSTVTKSITVSSSISPDISITTQNVCVGNNVSFTANSTTGGISTYDWDFDDGSSNSSATQPDHVYSSAGMYGPSLFITAANGCTNEAQAHLKLYDQPVAAFTTPSGLVCTNNEYTFVNNTTDDFDGLLEYSWNVDGNEVATTRDLLYTFSNTGNENIGLIVSIPGCSDNLTKPVNGIDSGPTVGFTFIGQCENVEISFTNGSSGDITGYSWNFDDGAVSTDTNPKHPFDDPGLYHVSLSTTGSNGCVSTIQHDVNVYTSPVPSSSLDLPPFSCSGTPSQFHDTTGPLPDSNIDTWSWTFGDGGVGSGKNPVHTYIDAGQYDVELSVTTDKGCSGSTTQQVTITQSPVASFGNDPACVDKSTKLNDTSTGGVSAWQWKIGSAVYTTQNAQHTFTLPGNYSVQLNVTGDNNCTATVTKQVVVPVVPSVSFEMRNPCAGQPAVFTDNTSSAADPVSLRNWAFGDNGNATGAEGEFAFANAGTFPVQLEIQTQSGCMYSGSQQVTIHPSPVASFTVSDASGPPPLHVTFTNTSTGAVSYQWNFNDGNQPSTEVSPQYTYTSFGDYVVNLTAVNTDGCRSSEMKIIAVVEPYNELALEDFSLVQPSGSPLYLGYVRVRNNGNYRIEAFAVSYEIGGGVRLRETVIGSLEKDEVKTFVLSNEFLDPGQSAYVCAELADDNNLADNKACETFEGTTVILLPYPNPADSYLNIESILSAAGEVRVRLYTASGGVAYDRSFDAGTGLSRLSLDIQNLSPGVYVAVVDAGSATSTRRILIAR